MLCRYPDCDGGYATGYCHNDCRQQGKTMTQDNKDEEFGKKYEGLPVSGYKPQSADAVARVNAFKAMEENTLRALDVLKTDPATDQRWLQIGRTSIEQGFMAVNRSVFKPDRVRLSDDGISTSMPTADAFNYKPGDIQGKPQRPGTSKDQPGQPEAMYSRAWGKRPDKVDGYYCDKTGREVNERGRYID